MTDFKEYSLQSRTFLVSGKISMETSDEVRRFLFECYIRDKHKSIDFLIDTGGGNTRGGLYTYDLIKGIPTPINTTAIGFCGSAGIFLLLAAERERRFGTQHSRYFIHAGTFTRSINCSENIEQNVRRLHDQAKEHREIIRRILNAETKLSKAQIKNFLDNSDRYDLEFGAEDALKFGLIHKIIPANETWQCFTSSQK